MGGGGWWRPPCLHGGDLGGISQVEGRDVGILGLGLVVQGGRTLRCASLEGGDWDWG